MTLGQGGRILYLKLSVKNKNSLTIKQLMKKLLLTILIQLIGAVMFILTLSFSKCLSLLFPILAYFGTYNYDKKDFWKAFVISILILTIAIFAFIFIIALTPYKIEVYRFIFSYIIRVRS